MGDRTFSSDDVIRIYEDFLTSAEQKRVDAFIFETLEPESLLPPVVNLLDILEGLLIILAGPLIAALAATFGSLTLATLNSAVRALAETNRILGNIIEAGEVDA